uniref:Olfactory receptor n=1 Tax=Sphenodon punctatus TaxID=8508 RepID=A0A8D0GEB8_SPHPU
MKTPNRTAVQEFILLGFTLGKQGHRHLLLIVFSAIYIISLVENLIIITVVLLDARLTRLPMYVLLGNFSWLEVCYISATVPRMLSDLASPYGVISFGACFLQFYIFFSLGNTEGFFLAAMALDRYLAICHPLRYPLLMSHQFCLILMASCWVVGFLWYALPVFWVSRLSYCGPNVIDHFMCDSGPLLALACSSLEHMQTLYNIFLSAGILGSFLIVLISYALVVLALLKMPNHDRRLKGFSTVSSHVTVVTLFYGSVAAMYLGQGWKDQVVVGKVVTLFYTAITPLLNPLIYCLRNEGMKEALGRGHRTNEQISHPVHGEGTKLSM